MTDKIILALKKAIKIFEENDIDYVIFGSSALALKLGNKELLKQSTDIDIFNLGKMRGEDFISLFRKAGFQVAHSRGYWEIVFHYPGAPIYFDVFQADFFKNVFPYFKKHNAYETVNFTSMKLKIRPPEMVRKDFLNILEHRYRGKAINEIIKEKDHARFLKTLIRLGMVSAYKDALGLRGKK